MADLTAKSSSSSLKVATKDKEAEVIAKALRAPLPKGRAKLKPSSLGSSNDDSWKVFIQGHTGTGKTLVASKIAQCLNREGRHNKIFVASTDIGGNGLRSVKDDLVSAGRKDLLDNICYVEFRDYREFKAFTGDPESVVEGFWEWDPDVLFWDGLANFQESHVWRYILDLDPLADKPSEVREEGVQAGIAEWGQIRRCTILQNDLLLTLHNPNGKRIHKVTTCLLDDGKESKLTHEVKKGPLIMGAARDYIGPAYDAMITTTVFPPKAGSKEPQYRYQCDVTSQWVAKKRGDRIPEEVLASGDGKLLWEHLMKEAK
jgi:hypothetical protein